MSDAAAAALDWSSNPNPRRRTSARRPREGSRDAGQSRPLPTRDDEGWTPAERERASATVLRLPERPEKVEPAAQSQEELTKLYIRWVEVYGKNAVAFATEVLGLRLMRHQRRFLWALSVGKRRIALRSGHRVGKTLSLAVAALWHLLTKYPQKCLITAPSAGQLFGSLFPEIVSLAKKLPEFLRDMLNFYTDEINLKSDPEGSFLIARTADPNKPEAFQGMHSANIMLIFDEASGIDERLFNAARGSMASPNAVRIMAGNPTRLHNTFHRAFTTHAEKNFKIVVSSLGLPTVDQDFVDEVRDEFGEDSNEYRIRVLGEFPETDDDSYISNALVKAAMARNIQKPPLSRVVYGVDPSRSPDGRGDNTVITRRYGLHYIAPQTVFRKKDTMQIVGEIQAMAQDDRDEYIREAQAVGRPLLFMPEIPAAVIVDVIGIGAGVVDRLKELGFNVIAINAAETSTDDKSCLRERDALWKRGLTWLKDARARLPKDDLLRDEMTGAHYDHSSAGVLAIESKKAMKKRGLRSPDRADSLFLALSCPPELLTNTPGIGHNSNPNSGRLSRASGGPTTTRTY
jgi:phage terminase large subunit